MTGTFFLLLRFIFTLPNLTTPFDVFTPQKTFLVGNSTRALRLWNKNWSYSILRASWYLFYDIFREIYEIFPWNCHKHNLEWRDRLGRSKLCGTLHAMYSKSLHSANNNFFEKNLHNGKIALSMWVNHYLKIPRKTAHYCGHNTTFSCHHFKPYYARTYCSYCCPFIF